MASDHPEKLAKRVKNTKYASNVSIVPKNDR